MCCRASVLVVLERDTFLGEFIADTVRLRPVLRRAGGIARIDQCFYVEAGISHNFVASRTIFLGDDLHTPMCEIP